VIHIQNVPSRNDPSQNDPSDNDPGHKKTHHEMSQNIALPVPTGFRNEMKSAAAFIQKGIIGSIAHKGLHFLKNQKCQKIKIRGVV
jgi:hypothetical protein